MLGRKTKLKVYFYNGFEAPKLVANSINELKDVTIFDNYEGDKTDILQEVISDCRDLTDLSEELPYYDLYVNPSRSDFIEVNKAWFPADRLEVYLDDFPECA